MIAARLRVYKIHINLLAASLRLRRAEDIVLRAGHGG